MKTLPNGPPLDSCHAPPLSRLSQSHSVHHLSFSFISLPGPRHPWQINTTRKRLKKKKKKKIDGAGTSWPFRIPLIDPSVKCYLHIDRLHHTTTSLPRSPHSAASSEQQVRSLAPAPHLPVSGSPETVCGTAVAESRFFLFVVRLISAIIGRHEL